ncbi:MAG: hypothetical protein WCJ81_00340 [bacterium]
MKRGKRIAIMVMVMCILFGVNAQKREKIKIISPIKSMTDSTSGKVVASPTVYKMTDILYEVAKLQNSTDQGIMDTNLIKRFLTACNTPEDTGNTKELDGHNYSVSSSIWVTLLRKGNAHHLTIALNFSGMFYETDSTKVELFGLNINENAEFQEAVFWGTFTKGSQKPTKAFEANESRKEKSWHANLEETREIVRKFKDFPADLYRLIF